MSMQNDMSYVSAKGLPQEATFRIEDGMLSMVPLHGKALSTQISRIESIELSRMAMVYSAIIKVDGDTTFHVTYNAASDAVSASSYLHWLSTLSAHLPSRFRYRSGNTPMKVGFGLIGLLLLALPVWGYSAMHQMHGAVYGICLIASVQLFSASAKVPATTRYRWGECPADVIPVADDER